MVSIGNEGSLVGLAHDLEEDFAARWVPDVLDNLDVAQCLQVPRLESGDVQFVDVPKADGGVRSAPIMSSHALRALRDAVSPLRLISDSLLDASVCGYRTGSTSGSAYSDEYMRFRNIGSSFADGHRYVATADVRDFFACIDVELVNAKMSALMDHVWEPIDSFLTGAKNLGINGLPAGYGDARLIANHILREPDSSIKAPFTRWVDDYRIFADTPAQIDRAVQRLSDSLAGLGLELNYGKLEVIPSDDYLRRRHGAPLESVYHPKTEPRNQVRAGLRTVFLKAVNENNRRLLRFSLPRLAEQRDAIAVDFALDQIARDSVDTPRLVHYLSAFLDRVDVRDRIEHLVGTRELSAWTTMRLCPLLCGFALQDSTLERVHKGLQLTDNSALWGALVRVAAVHGQKDVVIDAIAGSGPVDPRAAIGACVDVGQPIADDLRSLAPLTAKAAEDAVVIPRPSAYTLL